MEKAGVAPVLGCTGLLVLTYGTLEFCLLVISTVSLDSLVQAELQMSSVANGSVRIHMAIPTSYGV